MNEHKVLKSLHFLEDMSVDDWNALIDMIFKPYFISEEIFKSNKEALRLEIINYIKFCKDEDLMVLFNWIFNQLKKAVSLKYDESIQLLTDSFYDISNTDYKWMTSQITLPNFHEFVESDQMYFYFKVIDDIIEGCFKPRFKVLFNFVYMNHFDKYYNDHNKDFGLLLSEFSSLEKDLYNKYFVDPIFKIPINQWRNISAHKSFEIKKDLIVITYGKKNIHKVELSYDEFNKILSWISNTYRVLRLAQVLFDLNYIPQIVEKLGGSDKIKIRFESSLMHLVHNMQIVGFKFVSSESLGETYSLNFKKKAKDDLKSSLIHASQCLTNLACAVYDDEFIRDKYITVMVKVYNDDDSFASALIDIASALKFVYSEISQKDLIERIEFKL